MVLSTDDVMQETKGLFTSSEGPRSSGVGFFCFHALGDTKQKKFTPLDRGPPLHVNRVLDDDRIHEQHKRTASLPLTCS